LPVKLKLALALALGLAGLAVIVVSGATVSTLKVFVFESTLVFPTASVARARTVCMPSPSGLGGVNVQLPTASAVVVPAATPSRKTVTVLLASAVPLTNGCMLFVLPPFTGVITTGAGGGVVSITQVKLAGVLSALPAASTARTWK